MTDFWKVKKVNHKDKKRPSRGNKTHLWAEDWNEMVDCVAELQKRVERLENGK